MHAKYDGLSRSVPFYHSIASKVRNLRVNSTRTALENLLVHRRGQLQISKSMPGAQKHDEFNVCPLQALDLPVSWIKPLNTSIFSSDSTSVHEIKNFDACH